MKTKTYTVISVKSLRELLHKAEEHSKKLYNGEIKDYSLLCIDGEITEGYISNGAENHEFTETI